MSDRFFTWFFSIAMVVVVGALFMAIRQTVLDTRFCGSAGLEYRSIPHGRGMCMDTNGVVYDIHALKAKLRAKS